MARILHAAQYTENAGIVDPSGFTIYDVTTLCGEPGSIGVNAVECSKCLDIIYTLKTVSTFTHEHPNPDPYN